MTTAAQAKKYREKYPERVKASARAYYERNKEKIAAAKKEKRQQNREQIDARKRAWERENPDKVAMQRVRSRLRRERSRLNAGLKFHYNVTADQYDRILAAQGGVCAICREPSDSARSKRLFVDHDHQTGTPRGLLCHRCNAGLGYFRERPELFHAAVDYLFAWEMADQTSTEKWDASAIRCFEMMMSS